MAVNYRKLFYRLIDENMTPGELARKADVSLNIMTRIRRNEYISLESAEKICRVLNCGIEEILEFRTEGDNDERKDTRHG